MSDANPRKAFIRLASAKPHLRRGIKSWGVHVGSLRELGVMDFSKILDDMLPFEERLAIAKELLASAPSQIEKLRRAAANATQIGNLTMAGRFSQQADTLELYLRRAQVVFEQNSRMSDQQAKKIAQRVVARVVSEGVPDISGRPPMSRGYILQVTLSSGEEVFLFGPTSFGKAMVKVRVGSHLWVANWSPKTGRVGKVRYHFEPLTIWHQQFLRGTKTIRMARRLVARWGVTAARSYYYGLRARPYLSGGTTQPQGDTLLVEFKDMFQKYVNKAKRLPESRVSIFAIVSYPKPLAPELLSRYSLLKLPARVARQMIKDPWVNPYD